jgi:hypothetical protein
MRHTMDLDLIINPCTCGGIPYICDYYMPTDMYQEDLLYIIRCPVCGNCSNIEWQELETINNWNRYNTL